MRFGVLLKPAAHLGAASAHNVTFTLAQAALAEDLDYDDLWVAEPLRAGSRCAADPLTTAAFLLGRTREIRIGSLVAASPRHDVGELADKATLLDQLSQGRFELGLGGDPRDDEPQTTVDRLLDLWPSPPDLAVSLAASDDAGVKCAAANGLALRHDVAVPTATRLAHERHYRDISGQDGPDHLHTVIAVVTEASDARERLAASLRQSPGGGSTIDGAIIGPVGQVVDELGDFLLETRARRVAVHHEAIGHPAMTLESLECFAEYVIPQLAPGR